MTFPFINKNIPKCAIMHVEHDAKLVYCDVNINTFIFDTELTAKATIFFVLFDDKNVLQKIYIK
jgi:hypothetical protein